MLHVTELYCQLIKEGKLKFKESKKTYVYQDGCHIGRWGGVYEAPREIIKAIPGAKLVEMEPRIRDLMECCTGSLKRWGCSSSYALPAIKYWRDLSRSIIKRRFKEVKETGADVLTSTCGGCHRSFVGGNFERANKEGIDIVQISSLIVDLML
jgi:heterodisulfide reductase subunit D